MEAWDLKTADLLGPSAYPAEQPQASEDEDMAAQPFPMLDVWGQPVDQQYYYREQGPNVQIAQTPFKGARTIRIAGTTAYVDEDHPGLQDWASDMGYKLASYPGGGNMLDHMRVREDNELFNNADPQFQPERALQDTEPSGPFVCSECGAEPKSFGEFKLHMDTHQPMQDEIQDGHFPNLQQGDEPLGFGSNPSGTAGEAISSVKFSPWGSDPWAKRAVINVSPDQVLQAVAQAIGGTVSGYDIHMPEGGGLHLDVDVPGGNDIVVNNIVAQPQGSGLGTQAVNALRQFADQQGCYITIAGNVNPGFWGKFPWLDTSRGKAEYTPRTSAKEPKDLIDAAVPFVYDIPSDKLHIGYEGTTTHDVPGKISPGGIVEGYYMPGGQISVESYATHPWSVRHLLDLWYHHAPQMEITSIEQIEKDGSSTKLAADQDQGQHVGRYVQSLLQGDVAANTAYKALKGAGAKTYGVGGAPRDALLGKIPNDLDLMTAGLPAPEVEHILKKLPGHVVFAGKNFGVYHYYHPNGDHVEIAMPRTDDYGEGGSRGKGKITVDPDLPIAEDLKRRDFTANSSAVDLDTGEFIDPHGAADDIKRGVLRTTHPGAFREDPSRLIRALTMHGRHGLVPDEQTRHEMEANGHLLRSESPDTLNKTFTKLLESDNPASGIRLAKDTGLLQHILPEVSDNWDFDQKNHHHSYPVGEHLLHVLDNVSRLTKDPDVRFAGLLHDIGKPASAWQDPDTGENHYYRGPNGEGANHEDVGAQMAEDRLRKTFNLQRVRINRIHHLISNHMFAPFTTGKGARRFIHKVGDENVDDLLNLREADQTGKGQTPEEVAARTSADQMRGLVEQQRVKGDTTGVNAISVNGNDLLQMGMKPGPEVGKVLTQLQNAVVDSPSMNDRETLLGLAQQYAQASPSYSLNPPPEELTLG